LRLKRAPVTPLQSVPELRLQRETAVRPLHLDIVLLEARVDLQVHGIYLNMIVAFGIALPAAMAVLVAAHD
jgi:hypothetical protein